MQLGYIKARIYTSDAEIPVENAHFSVYDDTPEMRLLGSVVSDEEGNTPVIAVEAPDSYLSQSEGNALPFRSVNVRIDHPMYKTVNVKGAQIFAGQISIQETALVPIDSNVPTDSRSEDFEVSNQNL